MRTFLLITLAAGAVATDGAARPLSKVIKLLEDMGENLELEAEADQKIFNKMACWCNTNEEKKTKAIADAESLLSELDNRMTESKGTMQEKKATIAEAEKELQSAIDSLNDISDQRRKERAAWNDRKGDLKQTIDGCSAAVTILKKNDRSSLLQLPQTEQLKLRALLVDGINRGFKATDDQQTAISSFLQAIPDKPVGEGAYQSESGQIYGILQNMLDTNNGDLEAGQQQEDTKDGAFQQLAAEMNDKIAKLRDMIASHNEVYDAATNTFNDSKEQFDSTMETLADDKKFLADLQFRCQNAADEMAKRTQLRSEEGEAISKAVEVLTSDDAHASFGKSFNFMQMRVRSKVEEANRAKASDMLKSAAKALNKPVLSTLALKVRLDAFTEIKAAIDELTGDLKDQIQEEVQMKDACLEEFFKYEEDIKKGSDEKDAAEAEKNLQEANIERLAGEAKALQASLDDLAEEMKRAGDNRSKQNLEFRQNLSDQRATQDLLKSAIKILRGFYDKEQGPTKRGGDNVVASFEQQPAGFGEYKTQKAGGPLGMLENINNEVQAEINELTNDEKDAQADYETYHMDTVDTINKKNQQLEDTLGAKGTAEEAQSKASEALSTATDALAAGEGGLKDSHTNCDFLVKNFKLRQDSMKAEIEAMRSAKAILSGSGMNMFMQRRIEA